MKYETWPELEAVHPEIAAQWDCLGPPEGEFRFRLLFRGHVDTLNQCPVYAESLGCTGHIELPVYPYTDHDNPCKCYLYYPRSRRWISRHTMKPPVSQAPQSDVAEHDESATYTTNNSAHR